jgi:hypothetical protein
MIKCGNVHAQNVQTDSGGQPGVKRPGLEFEHPLQSTAEVRNEWNSTSTPIICLHGVDRESFTFISHAGYVMKAIRIKSVM